MKFSFIQINQFFFLMLFSLVLSSLLVILVLESNKIQDEKIKEHFKKMENEKSFVLILNEKFFSLVNMYCYDLINKNALENYLKDIKNKEIALNFECFEKKFNYNSFRGCKIEKTLSSYYFNLRICFK